MLTKLFTIMFLEGPSPYKKEEDSPVLFPLNPKIKGLHHHFVHNVTIFDHFRLI